MSKNRSYTAETAIETALALGYQISPEAVKLFQKLSTKVDGISAHEEVVPSFELIVRKVVEEKARSSLGSQSIGVGDLISTFPEIFDSIIDSKVTVNSVDTQSTGATQELEIIKDPTEAVQPTGIEGFAQLFKSRYEKMVKILMERPEGRQITKVSKLSKERGGAKVAGLVFSRKESKNGLEFTLDDDTGNVSILAVKPDVRRCATEIELDQCVLVDVEIAQGRLFAKSIIQPDVPSRVVSTSKKSVYAVFLSDLHIGSNKFLESAFNRFLEWLAGRRTFSEEDEDVVRRLKYIIVGGDVVDGVGVFPNQEYELAELDVYKQYEMVARKLKMVPEHLKMLVIPGNHDATRQALPQPMIPRKYASSLYGLPNVEMLGDPCLFKLHGVSILCYHGRSLDDVLATTPGLSYEKPEGAMKVLLRARHLAPTFGLRTPIAPEIEDHLVIEEVPDIFHTGHVHTVGVDRYKSTLLINSGTWQAQTGYQANLGITPRPGLVPIVNLATLDVTFREFLTSQSREQAG